MAYLVTTAIRNRKLGAFGPGQYYRPGLLHGWYRKKRGQMSSGLGQAPAVYGPPTPEQTPDWLRQALPTDPI
ncbi:MAG: hypothetical protein ACREVZ_07265, partial [Burkholderiales bacterium]